MSQTRNCQSQTTAPLMFCRDTTDTASHITTGWNTPGACGALPVMVGIGWTLGSSSAWLANLTICEDCKEARS